MRISFETKGQLWFPQEIHFPDHQLLLDHYIHTEADVCTVSIRNAEELLFVSQVVQSIKVRELHIAYLYGMRSDRPFNPLQPHYLRDVIGKVFTSMISPFVETVRLYTPHSNVAVAVIPKASKSEAVAEIVAAYAMSPNSYSIIYPDVGALQRWKGYLPEVDSVFAIKTRGPQGVVTQLNDRPLHKNILVLDDLCDGGASFQAIAKAIPQRKDCTLTLGVVHFLGNPAYVENLKDYVEIITTNSVHSSYTDSKITCVSCFPLP